MTGDGIMALFGAPIALEDAPQRAIRSALAIHREMASSATSSDRSATGIPPLKMRIGIHSGPVVVGTLGNNLRVEFKAVGDTVNLASRMEGFTEPGSTYLTSPESRFSQGSYFPVYVGFILVRKRFCMRLDTESGIYTEDFFCRRGSLRITSH